MTATTDPRELLKNSLLELQALRRELKAVEREKQERAAVIGAACRLPGASTFADLARRQPPDAAPFDAGSDHAFFGLEEAAAAALPPYLGPLWECVHEAIEHAGCSPRMLVDERFGAFIGTGGSQPQRAGEPAILPAPQAAQVPERVLYVRGPALNIDAGDASALAAIGLACRSLLAGEIDLAVAGAVAVTDARTGPAFAGCGLVVLRRLSEAEAQRDNVLAVIEAQANTAGGDALADLAQLFATVPGADRQDITFVALAGQMPAPLAASGAAVEHHQRDAGHLNGLAAFFSAIHAVQSGGQPAAVALAAEAHQTSALWLRPAPPMAPAETDGPHLLLLSALEEAALDEVARRLAAHLEAAPTPDLARVAYTLRAGRRQLLYRRYLVANSAAQAAAELRAGGGARARCAEGGRPPVFLFPGLGSHYLNMGRGLYQTEPVFRDVVDQCAALLQPHLGLDLRSIIFAGGPDQPRSNSSGQLDLRRMLRRQAAPADPAAARLNETVNAQPALFVVEYALARLLASWGVQPGAMIGFSLGEYVAACLAGVFTLEDALAVVAARARLIQALPPGKMLAVPLPEAELTARLGDGLAISAINGEALCVVAGEPAAVDALASHLLAEGIATQPLPTTHAFHTPLLRPIASAFREVLASVTLRAPSLPYVSNLTGDWIAADQATSPDYWIEHACQPVRFADGLRLLHAYGDETILEAGPSQALSSLVLAAAREMGAPGLRAVPAMRAEYDPQSDSDALFKALGELWLAGVPVDWEKFHPARKVGLPTYPFRRGAGTAAAPAVPAAAESTPTEQRLAALWRDLLKAPAVDPGRTFFEHGGNSLLATQLIFRLKKTFGVTLPLRALYEAPTLAGMAALIDGGAKAVAAPAGNGHAAAEFAGLPLTLPNGLAILGHSQAEVGHFYEDIYVERVYAQHGITLPPGAVVFDVGANIGLFSLFAHLEAPGARLFSFEPAPPLFRLLRANLERHGVAATLYNCALSSQPGTAEFTFYPKSTGMSSLYADLADEKSVLETVLRNQLRRGETDLAPLLEHAGDYLAERFKAERFTCPLRTLSEVMAEAGVDRIDLLKVDVQKAERDVLLGLADHDWPKVRQVVVEVHDVDGRLNELSALLAARGFHVETDQEALYAGSPIYLLYGTQLNH